MRRCRNAKPRLARSCRLAHPLAQKLVSTPTGRVDPGACLEASCEEKLVLNPLCNRARLESCRRDRKTRGLSPELSSPGLFSCFRVERPVTGRDFSRAEETAKTGGL